jgi:hypothetical protein
MVRKKLSLEKDMIIFLMEYKNYILLKKRKILDYFIVQLVVLLLEMHLGIAEKFVEIEN